MNESISIYAKKIDHFRHNAVYGSINQKRAVDSSNMNSWIDVETDVAMEWNEKCFFFSFLLHNSESMLTEQRTGSEHVLVSINDEQENQ